MPKCYQCEESVDLGWRYCVSCGVPVQQWCPYGGEHTVSIALDNDLGGRCSDCGKALRYCPDCHKVYSIRDSYCSAHSSNVGLPVPGTARLADYFGSYAGIRGGLGRASGADSSDYEFVPLSATAVPDVHEVRSRILPPISAYGYIYYFVPSTRTVHRIHENLSTVSEVVSPNVGPPCNDITYTNLATDRGLLGVLLDGKAALLDATSLVNVWEHRGDYHAQVFLGDAYFLFGTGNAGRTRVVAVDLKSLEIIHDGIVDRLTLDDSKWPLSDRGKVYFLNSSGHLIVISMDDGSLKSEVHPEVCLSSELGQPIIVDDGLYVVCSGERVVRLDLSSLDVSDVGYDRDIDCTEICGTPGSILIRARKKLGFVDCRRGSIDRRLDLPPSFGIKDVFLVKMRNQLAVLVHFKLPDGNFETFRCMTTEECYNLRGARSSEASGFIYSNGAAFIYSRERGSIARYVIGRKL